MLTDYLFLSLNYDIKFTTSDEEFLGYLFISTSIKIDHFTNKILIPLKFPISINKTIKF